jgi:microcompartment protein CcmK/EutM
MQGRHGGASANALLLQFVTALRNLNRTAARVDCLSGATCGETLHLHGGAAARNDHEHISMASFFSNGIARVTRACSEQNICK